jgi:hypothetical protein
VSKGGLFCFVGWLLAFGSPLVSLGGGIFPHIYLPTTGQVAPNDVAGLSNNHFWGFLSNYRFLGVYNISFCGF